MDQIWVSVITTVCTVLASLLVTFIFNKLTGLPKQLKKQKEAQQTAITEIKQSVTDLTARVDVVEEAVSHYPEYRKQSLNIQHQLQDADSAIVELCKEIKEDVIANRQILNERLQCLESREKNSLRAKILNEYRLYTDEYKNPMQAWSEMEHHSFFKLVEDYESLGGNDYVHKTILPAMNELDVISMSELDRLQELYQSRRTK